MLITLTACAYIGSVADAARAPRTVVIAPATQSDIDWQAVEQAPDLPSAMQPGGVFRIGMPRTDLAVTVRDVQLQPTFALGSYAAFLPMGGGTNAMVIGDLVLLDAEVPAVMSGLFAGGLSVTALHNHLNEITPHAMYLHYSGQGDAVQLATALRQALAASGTPLGTVAATPPRSGPELDTAALEQALGRSGRMMDVGVFQFSVPRAETITENGMELPHATGVTTALNFEPLADGSTAITGDFVLPGDEVNPVAEKLRAAGIDVTAIHNHALGDTPRLFYMHFWGTSDPLHLARALRTALDQTNSAH
jgi:hypothetical protein